MRFGPFITEAAPFAQGGLSKVFRGAHEFTGVRVAVKLVNQNPWACERMRREIAVQRRLDHPHVMPILQADRERTWLAMPLASGSMQTLQILLRNSTAELCTALLQVTRGLRYAHQLGLVHRDVSPGNVLRLSDGRWVVADWGLVHQPRGQAPPLTRANQGFGTEGFTAPEVFHNAATATASADAYSIGALAQWLTFGRRPRFRETCSPATRPWWDLVKHTLSSEEHERWSLREIQHHLEGMAAASGPVTVPGERCPRCDAQAGFDGGARCLNCGTAWPSYA